MHESPYVVASMNNFVDGIETQIGGIWGDIWHGTLEKMME